MPPRPQLVLDYVRVDENWTDALLHRIRGEILLKRNPANVAPVEETFLTAIAVAQQQKARSFELRAAMSLARLWRDQGKPQQARALLAPVYGWFTEGFNPQLQQSNEHADVLDQTPGMITPWRPLAGASEHFARVSVSFRRQHVRFRLPRGDPNGGVVDPS